MDRINIDPVKVGSVSVGIDRLTLICGPCSLESLSLSQAVAEATQKICDDLGFGFIFKGSFDKANRTSINSTRGPGIDEGLEILSKIKSQFNVPVTTDIHLPDQAKIAANVADLIQIPAFLCRQSDLLEAAAKTGKPVNIKKGQFLAPHDTLNIVNKMKGFQSAGLILTERGTSFGYNNLVVDLPGLEIMRSFGVPVCYDATHSAQRPGAAGESTGGDRKSIPAMVRAACAVGIDALFIEAHPDPDNAISDRATQWSLDQLRELLSSAQAICFAKSKLQTHR